MLNKKIQNYIITSQIGAGGMAIVYKAQHSKFKNKYVAVKILNPVLLANDSIAERFSREAEIMANLEHPNIVQVVDFEQRSDLLAIVMEFLQGQDLSAYIKQSGKLPLNVVLPIFRQALSAFEFAHAQGIVHRDVKPSNIFIETHNNNRVKILDFGIAKLLDNDAHATNTGAQMGTPVYMSPEQVKDSKHIDQRSDIYSLGVVLYYMLAGQPPYDSTSLSNFDIFTKIVTEPVPPLTVNTAFNAIVSKATAKNPAARFQTCAEFAQALTNTNLQGFENLEGLTEKKSDQTLVETQPPESLNTNDDATLVETFHKKAAPPQNKKTPPANQKVKKTQTPAPQTTQTRTEPKKNKWLLPVLAIAALAVVLFFIFRPSENTDWQKAQQQNFVAAYEQYLTEYPDGQYTAAAQENIDWLQAGETNTVAAYNTFKQKYGTKSTFYEQATQQIANLRYTAISQNITLPTMRQYMAGDSAKMLSEEYKEKATQLLTKLIADSTEYANNEALRQADKDAYDKAKRTNTKQAYNAYIAENPKGQYIADARQAIENLDKIPAPIQKLINDMVYVAGGTFQMGSNSGESDEKPVHSVTLSSFNIGKYEVTQAQWRAVMGDNPSSKSKGIGNNFPVNNVSWNDIQKFIRKLNQMTGKTFRLPTEAQWEYAAGGGNSNRTKYAGTNSESSLSSYAWYTSNSGSKTHPVGSKRPNRLGIYDMSGNVWELCSDWKGTYSSSSQTNPKGASSGSSRVPRGGSWGSNASGCRVADRNSSYPAFSHSGLGFRLVLGR